MSGPPKWIQSGKDNGNNRNNNDDDDDFTHGGAVFQRPTRYLSIYAERKRGGKKKGNGPVVVNVEKNAIASAVATDKTIFLFLSPTRRAQQNKNVCVLYLFHPIWRRYRFLFQLLFTQRKCRSFCVSVHFIWINLFKFVKFNFAHLSVLWQ